MTTDDVVKILEAVGDSWPAAVVMVSIVAGAIAFRALPRLKEIAESLKMLRHEFDNNSGKTLRDAVDRIEKTGEETRSEERREGKECVGMDKSRWAVSH